MFFNLKIFWYISALHSEQKFRFCKIYYLKIEKKTLFVTYFQLFSLSYFFDKSIIFNLKCPPIFCLSIHQFTLKNTDNPKKISATFLIRKTKIIHFSWYIREINFFQAEKFQSYFNNAKVVLVAGRTFPIEVFHVNPKINKSFSSTDYVYNAVICVKYVHLTEPKGWGFFRISFKN